MRRKGVIGVERSGVIDYVELVWILGFLYKDVVGTERGPGREIFHRGLRRWADMEDLLV